MPNHLIDENSPYLLQHANNPVDWYPWGEEALAKAKTEDKPVFLSIGYAACHWCHVMEHESFEDEITAAIMNEHFINIKVDREERPDLDNIYMQAVVAMTRQGGWPMSVFITPDGKPFYGGTYFPPVRRYNMPAFQEILYTIAHLWQEDRQQLMESAKNISEHIQNSAQLPTASKPISGKAGEQATENLIQSYDWQYGGWGQAPKFPQPMSIRFLLQRATRGDHQALEMAEHALQSMAKGGMYDVVGGGFARYSVDNEWKVPHFEKMLYDNSQLARVYLFAYLLTGKRFYRKICEETLEFVLREMTHPDGGFYSSLDADSEGEEGKFYIWTLDEIRNLRLKTDEETLLIAAYGISESGNFEGATILQRVLSDAELAQKLNLPLDEITPKLEGLHKILLEARSQKIRPATDDKILTSWNAWMSIAFAEAGRYLQREKYTKAAIQNLTFILNEMLRENHLLRSWRNGNASHHAYLEDYAGLILALLALYQSAPASEWYMKAEMLADEMLEHFTDPTGGFFDTSNDHEELLFRPKDVQDNATPSGNALAALALLQLSAFSGNGKWRDIAEKTLGNILEIAIRYPTSFAQWLCALDFAIGPVQEVVILGNPDFQDLQKALWSAYRPRLVAALSEFPPDPHSPAVLSNRPLRDQRPTAYVCQNFVCHQPVNSSEELRKELENL